MFEAMRGGLIVSCQPVPGGPMDDPAIVAAMARAALDGGATGLRIEGLQNLRAVRAVTDVPIIGLIKRDLDDSDVRITPLLSDARSLAAAGADIIAFDATLRPRPVSVGDLIATIVDAGAVPMADCATYADAVAAHAAGVRLLGSTLSGYTEGDGAVPQDPDIELVRRLAELTPYVLAEGRYHNPTQAAEAIRAGAFAVVAGSAITRVEHVTAWFAAAIAEAARPA